MPEMYVGCSWLLVLLVLYMFGCLVVDMRAFLVWLEEAMAIGIGSYRILVLIE